MADLPGRLVHNGEWSGGLGPASRRLGPRQFGEHGHDALDRGAVASEVRPVELRLKIHDASVDALFATFIPYGARPVSHVTEGNIYRRAPDAAICHAIENETAGQSHVHRCQPIAHLGVSSLAPGALRGARVATHGLAGHGCPRAGLAGPTRCVAIQRLATIG